MTTIAVAVVGTNLVFDYGTPEAARAAMAAIEDGTTLDWLERNIANVITPDAVKRVLIANWPTATIPDLSTVASQVCVGIHALLAEPALRAATEARASDDEAGLREALIALVRQFHGDAIGRIASHKPGAHQFCPDRFCVRATAALAQPAVPVADEDLPGYRQPFTGPIGSPGDPTLAIQPAVPVAGAEEFDVIEFGRAAAEVARRTHPEGGAVSLIWSDGRDPVESESVRFIAVDEVAAEYNRVRAVALRAAHPEDDGLDAAWKEAEAALPTVDWLMEVYHSGAIIGGINPHTGYEVTSPEHRYVAVAQPAWYPLDKAMDPPEFRAEDDTPAAALRALAIRLRSAP
jgi:hypothetical protein